MGIWAKLKQVRSAAQNEVGVTDTATQPVEIYASELMDEHTCQKCAEIDGLEYETLTQARADYPDGGGYKECVSESGCRGTLVSIHEG